MIQAIELWNAAANILMWLIKASVAKPLYYYLHDKADSWHLFSFLLCYRFLLSCLCLFITVACKHTSATQAPAPYDEATCSTLATQEMKVKAVCLNTSRLWINQLLWGKCYQSKQIFLTSILTFESPKLSSFSHAWPTQKDKVYILMFFCVSRATAFYSFINIQGLSGKHQCWGHRDHWNWGHGA